MMTALRMMQDDEEFAPAHVTERMAAAIVARLEQKGECRIDHLRALGFSLDDIARYWPQACKLAEAKRPRLIQ
jgi:hypothetical protein